jgi:hypothetical protein
VAESTKFLAGKKQVVTVPIRTVAAFFRWCRREQTMQYRNTDKSTLNSTVLGGIVVERAEDYLVLQFENLSKPRLGWYYKDAMIGKPKGNDSRIRVIMPNGIKSPLYGSLVAVYGVLVTDDNGTAAIMAEYVEDVTARYYKVK